MEHNITITQNQKPTHESKLDDGNIPSAIVIGAGFGGIASALRLRAKGYKVTLLERTDQLGGRARVFEKDGFRHDAGPTVITAPFLFDELFELFGKQRSDYIEFVPLNPWYRFYFQDGTTFNYCDTLEATIAEIERISPEDKDGYIDLLEYSKKIFEAGYIELGDQPFHNFFSMLKQTPRLLQLKFYRTVWGMVSHYMKHDKLRQIFSIHPLLVGGNPFETTSIYTLIHYLEREWGVHFAMGGTGAVVSAFKKLMDEVGITIRLNTTVETILVENGHTTGVRLKEGTDLKADIVVSNADPVHLYGHMLDKKHQSFLAKIKRKNMRLSMGLFVLYFGTNKKYSDIAHHTIWMGQRYQELLHDIFKKKILAEDFSLYLHRPTATDSSFAPEGCDSFYVLCPVPNLKGNIDWAKEGPKLQDRIIRALDQTILPDLKKTLQAPFYMTPEDFAEDYLSAYGAGFSVAPYFTQSAWFRFHNRGEGPKGLFLTGAGTHPGAGLPGVLTSAKVLEKLIAPADSYVKSE